MIRMVSIPNANGKAENLREGIWLTTKLEKPTVSKRDTKGFFKRREWVIIPRSKIHFSIWIGYIGLSVLLASAPIVPVYAGKQSTPSTSSGTTPTTGGLTPSINNPGQGGGGTQNTPSTPDTNQNTNTATPPQVVNQLAQQSMSPGAIVGIGAAGLLGLGLVGNSIYHRQYFKDIFTVMSHAGPEVTKNIQEHYKLGGLESQKTAMAALAGEIRKHTEGSKKLPEGTKVVIHEKTQLPTLKFL